VRERAARLASLYQATQEFTAELDLGRALEVIVERGRELTGADICYLSLNDLERGDTYIRISTGTRSDAFDSIRLRYGDGLGGLVAKEGRSYYSVDFLEPACAVVVAFGLATSVAWGSLPISTRWAYFWREDGDPLRGAKDEAIATVANDHGTSSHYC
jgi:GAF domain-containing protein